MRTIEYYQEEIEKDEKEVKKIKDSETVVKLLQSEAFSSPIGLLGEVFMISPENQGMVMDFTTKVGGCSNAYYSFVFQMPKWNYRMEKVNEAMAVSPTHMDAYNLFAGQKQKLEGQIKQGLASAMQAITDYELLRHDERRYREIIDYFKKGATDDHVLRSLFVDRVDAYTGEGYSMITMAKRWPTIINDFIRMGRIEADEKKKGVENPLASTEDMEKKLDVPLAEATVLYTKNELYKEWKELFRPVVQERYARIKAAADSRKESIRQYREWLKPYVARHKTMKEIDQAVAPSLRLYAPGFGTSTLLTSVRLWAWRSFPLEEKRKPESLKVKGENLGFPINPFDEWSKRWIARINIKYQTKFKDEDIVKMIEKFTQTSMGPGYKENEVPGPWMSTDDVYYVLFDVYIERSIIKTPPPEGTEMEDIMLNPVRIWLLSQNALLVHLVELEAIKEQFNREINEMIGAQEMEDDILNKVRKEMDEAGKEPEKEGVSFTRSMRNAVNRFERSYDWLVDKTKPFRRYFFRPGPYENVFNERITKLYLVASGKNYQQVTDFWKSKFNVR